MTAPLLDTVAVADGWRLGFEDLPDISPQEVELEVEGTLPAVLSGTLHRVGPARWRVGSDRYEHWFDGDAAVHAIRLDRGRCWYRSRFVVSAESRAETAAGRRLHAGFWTPPPGGPLARLGRFRPKNTGSINVVAHGGRLLALSEGGPPYRLDPDTLATLGTDDLGVLRDGDGFSAHPKFDPASGECWNFGVHYGPTTELTIFRGDPDGSWTVHARIRLARGPMIHDMALTDRSLVIVCPPLVLPRVPVRLLAGRAGYGQALRWEPRLGTTVVIVDRHTGEVRRHQLEPFWVFHLAAARDDADTVEIDLCTYPDASIITELAHVMTGRPPTARPVLERITLNEHGETSRRKLTAVPLEFPRTTDDQRTTGVTITDDARWANAPCIVAPDGHATVANIKPGEFAGEPIPIHDDYLLTLVLNAPRQRSELHVYSTELGPPLAVVPLPHTIPFGLHGNFIGTSS